MTTFDDRERSFETKFAHDAELRFKAEARRNRLLGEWAAEKLGKTTATSEDFPAFMVIDDRGGEGQPQHVTAHRHDAVRPGLLLTIATASGPDKFGKLELAKAEIKADANQASDEVKAQATKAGKGATNAGKGALDR